jgi:pyruvate formate lyase activating enzyme
MVSFAYGRPVALQVDPIEKKPLNEFLPGTRTFSLGTFGCNLDCVFCQNHHLSRGRYSSSDTASEPPFPPEKIAELAVEKGCGSVAFTYNEPLVWGEYVVDCAAAARMRGLKTVLVSNAYVELSAARDIFPLIDAANFDVKGFGSFYDGMTGGKLRSVLDAVEFYHSLGGHLEITNLVVPGRNDGDKEVSALLDWASSELGLDVPLHFSAFHPAHRFHFAPPTPKETLFRIRDMALERGFESVYLGNVVV